MRPLIGFSADALTVSKPRRVGQDCTRAGTPFALDEIVSMKWSGVLGAGTPSSRWVQGERSLPRVMNRRNGSMAQVRLDA